MPRLAGLRICRSGRIAALAAAAIPLLSLSVARGADPADPKREAAETERRPGVTPLSLSLRHGSATSCGRCAVDASDHDSETHSTRFMNLRFDEDFSYLEENPELRDDEPRLRLKNIRLADRWRLDVGGEFRLRWESRSNQHHGRAGETQQAQQNYRWLIHANIRHEDNFRLFFQGIAAHVEDQDGPFQPTQENHGDVQQIFADVRIPGGDERFTLRIGRQELAYGAYRLVGPLDWVSTRRRFDGVKLMYRDDLFDVDAFFTRPVIVRRESMDAWNEDRDFYGVYATYKGIPDHWIDAYFLGLQQRDQTVNPNGRAGDHSTYTIGGRFGGRSGRWDYDTELAGQWGSWAGDRVHAWSAAIDAGYTIEPWPMKPRLSAGFDYSSGDEDPYDGKVGTFNQLYPFDHVCIGMQDLVGRQNLTRSYVALDFWPVADKLKVAIAHHHYWLSQEKDAAYDAGGIARLRDGSGRSGLEFGNELDIWVDWSPNAHSSLSVGYCYFFNGAYVHDRVRDDDNPSLVIVQYRYRF